MKTWPEWKQNCLGGAPAVERQEPEFPAGAIHNGRAFIDQLESTYAFKEQQGHPLSLCSEWQELVRCFEWLATHATEAQATMAQLQERIGELESGRGKISIEVRECEGCNHIGIDDQHSTLGACHECDWSGPEPVDDKCPGCQRENCMSAACPDCGSRYVLVASKTIEVKPKSAVSDKYDDVLLPFLSLMRAELHANAHKGDRPGWLQMDRKTAVLEVFYHMGKLHQAVHRDEKAAIKEYAADVANMCMMLLDVCACLDATAALNEVKS